MKFGKYNTREHLNVYPESKLVKYYPTKINKHSPT